MSTGAASQCPTTVHTGGGVLFTLRENSHNSGITPLDVSTHVESSGSGLMLRSAFQRLCSQPKPWSSCRLLSHTVTATLVIVIITVTSKTAATNGRASNKECQQFTRSGAVFNVCPSSLTKTVAGKTYDLLENEGGRVYVPVDEAVDSELCAHEAVPGYVGPTVCYPTPPKEIVRCAGWSSGLGICDLWRGVNRTEANCDSLEIFDSMLDETGSLDSLCSHNQSRRLHSQLL